MKTKIMRSVFVCVLGISLMSRGSVLATDAYECDQSLSAAGWSEWNSVNSVANGIWTLDTTSDVATRGGAYKQVPYGHDQSMTVDIRFRITAQSPSNGLPLYLEIPAGTYPNDYLDSEIDIGQSGYSIRGGGASGSLSLGTGWHILRAVLDASETGGDNHKARFWIDDTYLGRSPGVSGGNDDEINILDNTQTAGGIVEIDYVRCAVDSVITNGALSNPMLRGSTLATDSYECIQPLSTAGWSEWNSVNSVANGIWTLDTASDVATRGGGYKHVPYGHDQSMTVDIRFRITAQSPSDGLPLYLEIPAGSYPNDYFDSEIDIGQSGYSIRGGGASGSLSLGTGWHTLRAVLDASETGGDNHKARFWIDDTYLGRSPGVSGGNDGDLNILDNTQTAGGIVEIDYVRYAVDSVITNGALSNPMVPCDSAIVRNVKDFGAVGNGVTDDTDAIQAAIGHGAGITYFPSGTYVISRELKVWGEVGGAHLVGDYSGNRPTLLLKANTPGYDNPGAPAYVFRFYQDGPPDAPLAWTDTFDSQLDGIDITMGSGNPGAIGIYHPGAQNSSIRNCRITMDGNLIGIFWLPGDSVNENIEIIGGTVGVRIHAGQWPNTLKGCTFTNQTVAAIDAYQCGLVLEGCVFDGAAAGVRVPSGVDYQWPAARLYLESCIFKNISGGNAIVGTNGTRHDWLLAMKNVFFQNVTNIAYWTDSSSPAIAGQASGWCRADYVTHGNRWHEGTQVGADGQNCREVTGSVTAPTFTATDFVDAIPSASACVNVKSYGAVGDGVADDTQAIRDAIAYATQPIWFPMGIYRVNDTITLNADTKLIGEHSAYTDIKLVLEENDTSFNDPANPKPLIDTVDDSDGTGVFAHFTSSDYVDNPETPGTVEFNGMIGIRWRLGRNSILDDIHSWNTARVGETQTGYAALKITGGGGGHVRQFTAPWLHNSGPGMLIIDGTVEPITLYGISFEHDMNKPEVYLTGATDVTFRQLQAEENQSIIDAHNCNDLVFNSVHYNAGNSLPVAMHFTNCSNVEIYTYFYNQCGNSTRFVDALHWLQNGIESIVSETGIAGYRRLALFYDGFESGNFTAGGWTNSGCIISSSYRYAGSKGVEFNSSDSLTKSFSTSGFQNIQVSYARYTRQCETDDHFIVEWYNGSNWTTLEDVTGNSSWTVRTFGLPSGANNNSNFRIRFRTSHNGTSDYAYVDEVKIIGTAIP